VPSLFLAQARWHRGCARDQQRCDRL